MVSGSSRALTASKRGVNGSANAIDLLNGHQVLEDAEAVDLELSKFQIEVIAWQKNDGIRWTRTLP